MRIYKCLFINHFTLGDYSLVPVRDEDKYSIMKWRNEQIDILRQKEPLTKYQQENYFKNIVNQLFEEEQPKQILWSFVQNGESIGYGGLVHIDWHKKEAEISFLTKTERNLIKEQFISDWIEYLKLVKRVARQFLQLKRIYTYAYDIRPHLFFALESSDFKEIKRKKKSISINGVEKDIVIHSIDFPILNMRMALAGDVDVYYSWVNDEDVRINSYSTSKITYDEHKSWFTKKINSEDCYFYFFSNQENIPVGQVRIDNLEDEYVIGISIDAEFRKSNYSTGMLVMACRDYLKKFKNRNIIAYIKEQNNASLKIFLNAGFEIIGQIEIYGTNSFKLKKSI